MSWAHLKKMTRRFHLDIFQKISLVGSVGQKIFQRVGKFYGRISSKYSYCHVDIYLKNMTVCLSVCRWGSVAHLEGGRTFDVRWHRMLPDYWPWSGFEGSTGHCTNSQQANKNKTRSGSYMEFSIYYWTRTRTFTIYVFEQIYLSKE